MVPERQSPKELSQFETVFSVNIVLQIGGLISGKPFHKFKIKIDHGNIWKATQESNLCFYTYVLDRHEDII